LRSSSSVVVSEALILPSIGKLTIPSGPTVKLLVISVCPKTTTFSTSPGPIS
jgi:hypothetical protein